MASRVYTVKTALSEYFQDSLGETKFRELLRQGQIRHQRVGSKILIKEEWLDDFMNSQSISRKLKAVK